MTDYELLIAFHTNASTANTVLMDFATVLFAYLIAGYFVADKLSNKMAMLVTTLFTVVIFLEATSMLFYLNDAFGLIPEMRTRDALKFHGVVSGGQFAPVFFNITYVSAAIISYFGALIFFFYQRRAGMKTSGF